MMFFISLPTLSAQDSTLPAEVPIFLLQDGQIMELNTDTGAQTTISQAPALTLSSSSDSTQPFRLFSADIDPAAEWIYVLEFQGLNEQYYPTGTRIMRVNVQTGQEILFRNDPDMYSFAISPDGQRVAIFYLDDTTGLMIQHVCILNIASTYCQPLPFAGLSSAFLWLDNERLLLTVPESAPVRIVNVETMSIETIDQPEEWFVYTATPIPNTTHLLLAGRLREGGGYVPTSFLTYNFDTAETQVLPFAALNVDDFPAVGMMSFSSNGQYLLYQGDAVALIEFATGRLITRLEFVTSFGWLDDQTLLVQGSRDGTTPEIMRIDASTGEIVSLASGDSAGGVLLVP